FGGLIFGPGRAPAAPGLRLSVGGLRSVPPVAGGMPAGAEGSDDAADGARACASAAVPRLPEPPLHAAYAAAAAPTMRIASAPITAAGTRQEPRWERLSGAPAPHSRHQSWSLPMAEAQRAQAREGGAAPSGCVCGAPPSGGGPGVC